jgi:hypothetical protein
MVWTRSGGLRMQARAPEHPRLERLAAVAGIPQTRQGKPQLMVEWCHQALSDQTEETTAFENSAYLSRIERADERTRTADLLITSDNSRGARSCPVVQNACKPALIYLQLPSATSSPTIPVVSEWYQKA